MHNTLTIGILSFIFFLGACSPQNSNSGANTSLSVGAMTNVQLLVLLNDVVANAGRTGQIDPADPIAAEVGRRELLTQGGLTNLRRNVVERGMPKAHAIAAWGMPTHIQYIGNPGEIYEVLYYYRNRGLAYQRQMIATQNNRVVGLNALVRIDDRPVWSGSGVFPVGTWKLSIPDSATIYPPVAPQGVLTCRGPSVAPCQNLRVH